MNTILIAGCSSGFGPETARYFLDRDSTVIASTRTPREDVRLGPTVCGFSRSTSPMQTASR